MNVSISNVFVNISNNEVTVIEFTSFSNKC